MKVWSGTAFIEKPTKVWDGTTWVTKPVKVWDGTTWVVRPTSGGGPGTGAWKPTDLGADLLAWYDANDNATVIITGSGVSQWGDKSGLGHHATQSSDASRPTHPSQTITFAGSQFLSMPPTLPAVYDYAIYAYPQGAGNYRVGMWGANGAGLMLDPSDYLGVWSYAGFTWSGKIWATNTAGICYGSIHNSVDATLSLNGSPQVSTGHTVETSQLISLCRNDYGQPFGSMFELVYVTYGLPLTVKQKLEGYLAWKWGNTALLPSDHPYKGAPP